MTLPPPALCCSIREHPQLCQQTGKYSCLFHEQICKRQDSLSNLRDRPQQTDICLKSAFHRDLQKCKTISLFSLIFFLFGKQLYFHKNVLFLLTMGLLHHLYKQSSLRAPIIVKNTKGGSGLKKLENTGSLSRPAGLEPSAPRRQDRLVRPRLCGQSLVGSETEWTHGAAARLLMPCPHCWVPGRRSPSPAPPPASLGPALHPRAPPGRRSSVTGSPPGGTDGLQSPWTPLWGTAAW